MLCVKLAISQPMGRKVMVMVQLLQEKNGIQEGKKNDKRKPYKHN